MRVGKWLAFEKDVEQVPVGNGMAMWWMGKRPSRGLFETLKEAKPGNGCSRGRGDIFMGQLFVFLRLDFPL